MIQQTAPPALADSQNIECRNPLGSFTDFLSRGESGGGGGGCKRPKKTNQERNRIQAEDGEEETGENGDGCRIHRISILSVESLRKREKQFKTGLRLDMNL
ncbi:hypothetical protein Q5P01_018757 [Channa striata]|uniref:Uncharacterized protein n=1 Tax=Channa striata TaxID=64152 RepID=A0AA88S9J3_CHASR|nr:hypothetical protein Q5P01_018757 [Channa striata]